MVHEGNTEDAFSSTFMMYNNYTKKKPFTDDDQSATFDTLSFNTSEIQQRNSQLYNSMLARTPGMGNLQNVSSQQFGRSTAGGLQGGTLTPTNNDNSINLHNPNRMNAMYPMNNSLRNQLSTNPGMQSPTQSISPEMYTNRLNASARNPVFANQQPQQSQFQSNVVGNDQFPQLHRTHPNMLTSPTSPIDTTSGHTMGITGSSYMEEYPPLKGTRPIGSQNVTGTSGAGGGGTGLPKTSVLNKPTESSEFTMQSEDFPALPVAATGMNNHMNSVFPDQDGRGDESNHKFNPLGVQIGGQGVDKTKQKLSNIGNNQQKGIQILPDNTVKNIPPTMLRDQYGIVGLLAFIKAAETDPNLTHLALGTDLTTLGLNLNSPEPRSRQPNGHLDSNLYHKFQSPFSRQPCRLQDIDCFVPSEYLTNAQIRDKLAPIKLGRYGEDLLFFVFYSYPGDIMQFAAAAELYNRDWRFHKEERVWITRAQGIEPTRKTTTFEQGTYVFFDCKNWKKTHKEFYLDYEKLEERPQLPNLTALHHNPNQHG